MVSAVYVLARSSRAQFPSLNQGMSCDESKRKNMQAEIKGVAKISKTGEQRQVTDSSGRTPDTSMPAASNGPGSSPIASPGSWPSSFLRPAPPVRPDPAARAFGCRGEPAAQLPSTRTAPSPPPSPSRALKTLSTPPTALAAAARPPSSNPPPIPAAAVATLARSWLEPSSAAITGSSAPAVVGGALAALPSTRVEGGPPTSCAPSGTSSQ